MKAIAFAPGHISGFFEPVYHPEDLTRTGSRGAGINITLGALTEVSVSQIGIQNFDISINNKRTQDPVISLALKYLLRDNPLNVTVKTKTNLPSGQGFGISAASVLSTTMALTKIVNISKEEALKASHFAEIQMKTGLGDVIASSFGGIEIRKSAGLPPWGLIEHIPGTYDIVLCVIGKKINTKKVLNDKSKMIKISGYGKYCTKKILESPSIENLFNLSQTFTEKTGISDVKVKNAIKSANKYGMASMCMLGNSIFAIGKTEELVKVLSPFGKIFVCSVDENGARVIE
jgi:pantoate kinase